jgi:pimeloyl-ACP methyl ester carboxylesterase
MPADTSAGQRRTRIYLPASDPADTTPLVVVHGASTTPALLFEAFLPFATAHRRILLAPSFCGPGGQGFQQLSAQGRPLGAAHLLEALVEDTAGRLGVPLPRIDMMGFSGGAQFVHRYALVRPQRVRRYVAAAAGWYTRLDPDRPFPHGLGAGGASADAVIHAEPFLRIPGCVTVGERDVVRDARLRTGRRIDTEQGEHRLARALRWVDHIGREASFRGLTCPVRFDLLPRTGHSFREAMATGDLGRRAMDMLADVPTD